MDRKSLEDKTGDRVALESKSESCVEKKELIIGMKDPAVFLPTQP
jgi:hypothetical protein